MNQELDALIDELAEWKRQGKKLHQSHYHTLPDAAVDKGGLKFCPGCRAITIAKRLRELTEAMDDDKPQGRFDGKSRRDVVLARLQERRAIEA